MTQLLAHTGNAGGYGDNPILTPWEIHPILIHFPIAFLLGAVLLSAYAWIRVRPDLQRLSTAFLLTGVVTGWLAGAAGLLAFLTMPDRHTETAHWLMYWHLGFMVGSLLLFTGVVWARWRSSGKLLRMNTDLLMWLSTAVFIVGAAFGGYIVYHGGAGIEGNLLKPGLHEHDHPHHGSEESRGHSGHESSHGGD